MVGHSKLVGITGRRGTQEEVGKYYLEVHDINLSEAPQSKLIYVQVVMEKDINKIFSQFRDGTIMDFYNNCLWFPDFDFINKRMNSVPIQRSPRLDIQRLKMEPQAGLNIVANHVNYNGKQAVQPKGLLYQDFLCCDYLLVLLHDRVITCFDTDQL